MIASWSIEPRGKCDVIDGVGHVMTTFVCAGGVIPLLPLRSWLVLDGDGDGAWRPLPLRLRSIALVYLSAVIVIVGASCLATGIFVGTVASLAVGLGFGAAGIALLVTLPALRRRLQQPSAARRAELLRTLQGAS